MKRATTLLVLFSACLLASCLNKEEPKDPYADVRGGLNIFAMVNPTNFCSLDPVNVAFKLNALLTRQRELSTTDGLETLTVSNDSPKLMCEALFGENEATFQQVSGGVWKITFRGVNSGAADYKRTGSITIYTGGRLMQDLPETTEQWSVALEGTYENYLLNADDGTTYSIKAARDYTISGGEDANSWNISCSAVEVKGANRVAYNNPRWAIDYDLALTASTLSFEGLKSSKFSMSGLGTGTVANYVSTLDLEMTYEIEAPVKSEAACKLSSGWKGPFQYSGTVGITVDREVWESDYFNKEKYPSNYTKWWWTRGTGECELITTISYNGKTYSSNE